MKKHFLHRPDSLVNDAWLEAGNLDKIEIENKLIGRSKYDLENPGLLEMRIMRDPNYLSFAAKTLLDIDLLPFQSAILQELWIRPFPMLVMSRGGGKSWLLSVYTMLKCALIPGTKVVGIGSAFRQARVMYEYMDKIWKDAPVLRSVCSNNSGPRQAVDRCSMIVNDSSAIYVPLGDGSKIRGLRAHTIVADEYSSIPPDVYETVVRGFAAVSSKPLDNVKTRYRRDALKKQGRWTDKEESIFKAMKGNQCIIAGTADYDFMHFADRWKEYIVKIRSEGDPNKQVKLPSGETKTLKDYYDGGKIPESFNSNDYSIIRIPYELIPKGFMDDKVVAAAKSSTHKAIYFKEYASIFPLDSDGFFKRSMLEACVAKEENINNPNWPAWCPSPFDPVLRGRQDKQYVIGIDPAMAEDNFAIVVLELWGDHTRIVYCWSTNAKDYAERKKAGIIKEDDYYGFCARKIRNLSKVFPTDNIVIDMQGGGSSVAEALHDRDKLEPGETQFWITNEILYPNKELPSDDYAGRHIIHPFQFNNYEHCSGANNNTRKDFSDKVLLFPRFDPAQLEIAMVKDNQLAKELKVGRIYDTLEDCVMEIEELKNELSSIVMTRTGTGVNARDRWDTPETVNPQGKKAHQRKDRYSALVMANYIARSIQRAPASVEYSVIGGFAHQLAARKDTENESQNLYQGPEWFTAGMESGSAIGQVCRKNSISSM